MGNQTQVHNAKAGSVPYIAGELLYKNGPMPELDLLKDVACHVRVRDQDEALQRALRSGWLTVVAGGKIDCGARARAHYDELAGKVAVKYIGQIAAPREGFNAFDRPPLRKAYIPNSRGIRQDVPAWSVREGASFKVVAGGEA